MAEGQEAAKGLGDAVASLGSAITAPAKVAFAGYVILAYTRKIEISTLEFFLVAALFLAIQIWHDDYLRIRLNKCADLGADVARVAAARAKKLEPLPEDVVPRLDRIEALLKEVKLHK